MKRTRETCQAARLTGLLCCLGVACIGPEAAGATVAAHNAPESSVFSLGFEGPYAFGNFTLINLNLNPSETEPANGFAEITPDGRIIITGSNTGSGLPPGAITYLTTVSSGAGEVRFQWEYASLDIPGFDSGGYVRAGIFSTLADSDGQSGSVAFTVSLGETFGFGVRTEDNAGEPGILTISNFEAPAGTAIPEPATFGWVGGIASLMIFRRHLAMKFSRGRYR